MLILAKIVFGLLGILLGSFIAFGDNDLSTLERMILILALISLIVSNGINI